jgi:hypothetical protein
LPDWAWWQWAGGVVVLAIIGFAGLLVYAVFWGIPSTIEWVEDGEEVFDVWMRIRDRRAAVRGVVSKKMILYLGGAGGLLAAAGVLAWILY